MHAFTIAFLQKRDPIWRKCTSLRAAHYYFKTPLLWQPSLKFATPESWIVVRPPKTPMSSFLPSLLRYVDCINLILLVNFSIPKQLFPLSWMPTAFTLMRLYFWIECLSAFTLANTSPTKAIYKAFEEPHWPLSLMLPCCIAGMRSADRALLCGQCFKPIIRCAHSLHWNCEARLPWSRSFYIHVTLDRMDVTAFCLTFIESESLYLRVWRSCFRF